MSLLDIIIVFTKLGCRKVTVCIRQLTSTHLHANSNCKEITANRITFFLQSICAMCMPGEAQHCHCTTALQEQQTPVFYDWVFPPNKTKKGHNVMQNIRKFLFPSFSFKWLQHEHTNQHVFVSNGITLIQDEAVARDITTLTTLGVAVVQYMKPVQENCLWASYNRPLQRCGCSTEVDCNALVHAIWAGEVD